MKSANAKQTLVCAYVNGRGLDFALEFWSGGHGLGQWVRAKNELGEVVDL